MIFRILLLVLIIIGVNYLGIKLAAPKFKAADKMLREAGDKGREKWRNQSRTPNP